MSLSTRLTCFFLTALGVVLASFSTGFYLLAAGHLHRHDRDRLEAALHTLTAAGEVKPGAVEWEPQQRRLVFGRETVDGPILWRISDDKGGTVDHSPSSLADGLLLGETTSGPVRLGDVLYNGTMWRVAQRRLDGAARDATQEGKESEPLAAGESVHSSLLFTVATSLEPSRTTLQHVALTLGGLSLATWLAALAASRALCRWALAPMRRMADAARWMGAADLSERLPSPRTGDELEDLAKAFNGLLDRLQESFVRQGRFTGDASHQLRTPLTAMLGQVELALRRPRNDDEYRRALATVQSQAVLLRQVIESLLFLARADADAEPPHLERLELVGWLNAYIERSWGPHPRRDDLRQGARSIEKVWAEAQPVLLEGVLNNLIDNAFKFSAAGRPTTVHLQRDNGEVAVTVEDGGMGIAPEDGKQVFQPFFRSPATRRLGVGGVGLGLAIAQRLARALRGRLDFQSEPGVGSRFTLYLPEAAPAQPEATAS